MEVAQEVQRLQERLAVVKSERHSLGLAKPDYVVQHGGAGGDDEVKFNYEAISKDMVGALIVCVPRLTCPRHVLQPVAHKAALMRLDTDGNGESQCPSSLHLLTFSSPFSLHQVRFHSVR